MKTRNSGRKAKLPRLAGAMMDNTLVRIAIHTYINTNTHTHRHRPQLFASQAILYQWEIPQNMGQFCE